MSEINYFTCKYKKDTKVFHLFENIDLLQRRLNYLDVNINYLQVNMGNYYNSMNPMPNFVYYNNSLLINPKAPYSQIPIIPAV